MTRDFPDEARRRYSKMNRRPMDLRASEGSSLSETDVLEAKPAVALFDFTGNAADGELSFKAGERLEM